MKKQRIANSANTYLFNYLYEVELFLRKEIGIRPTPLRWNLWAGKPLLISWNEAGDYLLCFKPSPLFYFFILPSLQMQKGNTTKNLGKNGKLYYLWKGGELLISNNATPLQQPVEFSNKPINIENNTAYIEFVSKVKASIALHVDNNLYIDGKIISSRKTNIHLPPPLNFNDASFSFAFPCYPLMDLLSDISLHKTILSLIPQKALQPIYIWLSIFTNTSIENLYQKIRDKGIFEKSIFFYSGISDTFSNPIPMFSFWFPYENNNIQHLLSELDLDLTYYPHQWGASQGYIIPIWSNAFCLSLLYYEKGWLVSSQEPLMAEILENLKENKKKLESNPMLTLNLSKISEDIEKILLWSAQQELLIGINERDISNLYTPWKQFFKELGIFTINTIHSVEHQEELLFSIYGEFINEK